MTGRTTDRAASVRPARGGSAVWMLLGTVVLGASGYVFLSVIGHDRFPAPVLAALTATYLLTTIVGPGVFTSVEQETSRAVSDLRQRGRPVGRTARRLGVVAAVVAAGGCALTAAAAPTLSARVLGGDAGLLVSIGATVVGSAAVFLVRGLAGGRGRFGLYATSLLVDGGVRLAVMALLVAAGDRTPALFALALAAGPVAAAVVTGCLLRRAGPDRHPTAGTDAPPPWSTLARAVALLMISSLVAFAMANLGPVVVTAASPEAPAVAAGFAVGLVLTRIPLLLSGPVQALMLPRMARAVARGDRIQLRRDLTRGGAALVVVGTLLALGSAGLGQFAVRLLFGDALDTTSATVLGLCGASAGLLLAVAFVQPALVALRRPGGLVLGWSVGAAGFAGILFLLPAPPTTAAVVAQLAGPALTVLVHLLVIRRALPLIGAPLGVR